MRSASEPNEQSRQRGCEERKKKGKEESAGAGDRSKCEGGIFGVDVLNRQELRSFRDSSALIGLCRVRGQRSCRIGQVGKRQNGRFGRAAVCMGWENSGGLLALEGLSRVIL